MGSHYDVMWLIVSHITRPLQVIINFHWLIVLGLMIMIVDDVKTFAHDSYEQITYFMGFDWWTDIAQLTQKSELIDLTLWVIMSQKGHVMQGKISYQA